MADCSSKLFIFGCGDCGQLGLGEDVDLVKRPKEHPFFSGKGIKQIAAGGMHTLALSSSSKIYSWGCNDECALGHGGPEYEVGEVILPSQGLTGSVVQVAAGDSISALLTSTGQVWTWGTIRDSKGVLGHHHQHYHYHHYSSKRIRQEILGSPSSEHKLIQETPKLTEQLFGVEIKEIAAGANHLLARTSSGEVWAWGCGEQGQLGKKILERHKSLSLRPCRILANSNHKIASICCGSYHSLLIGQNGELYSMGLNNYGQLGFPLEVECVYKATKVPLPFKVVSASAGEHHSLLLDDCGSVWAMGRTDSGQCGIRSVERAIPTPTRIPFANRITAIGSGGNHCLVVDSKNDVYSWGYGEMCQLGHGAVKEEDEILFTPQKIDFSFGGKILQVEGGGQHSCVLSE